MSGLLMSGFEAKVIAKVADEGRIEGHRQGRIEGQTRSK